MLRWLRLSKEERHTYEHSLALQQQQIERLRVRTHEIQARADQETSGLRRALKRLEKNAEQQVARAQQRTKDALAELAVVQAERDRLRVPAIEEMERVP